MTDRKDAGTDAAPFDDIEKGALAGIAAMIIPPSDALGLPGADDPEILSSIVEDARPHRAALAPALSAFAAMDTAAPGTAQTFREAWPAEARLMQMLVAQCYYRDARVMRSLSMEVRAPFPGGYEVEPGDWSLLDPVRTRGPFYRAPR